MQKTGSHTVYDKLLIRKIVFKKVLKILDRTQRLMWV